MGILDGLFGGGQQMQAQAPGQGLLGDFGSRMTQMQQTNPEAFIALGAGLLNGDMAQGAAGMGKAIGQYRGDMRQDDLYRDRMAQDQGQFDKRFGLQQAEFNNQLAAQGTERAQQQAINSATFGYLQSQGAPKPILDMAAAGAGAEAMRTWQTLNSRPDLQFKTLPDGTYGPFNPSTGEFDPMGTAIKPASDGMEYTAPDGSTFRVGGKALTEAQSKDATYSTRAAGALPILDKYDTALTSRTDAGLGVVPFGLGRDYQNDDFQLAKQAGDEFLQAILRKDTGAAITEGEQSLYGETYLPRPGDSENLIKQKKQARRRALEALQAGMPPSAIIAKEMALQRSQPPGEPNGPAETPTNPMKQKYGLE